MAKKPKKFGGLANTRQEPWKASLPEYIEELYFKHFQKSRPENVRSIEQMVHDERSARKQTAPRSRPSGKDESRPQ